MSERVLLVLNPCAGQPFKHGTRTRRAAAMEQEPRVNALFGDSCKLFFHFQLIILLHHFVLTASGSTMRTAL